MPSRVSKRHGNRWRHAQRRPLNKAPGEILLEFDRTCRQRARFDRQSIVADLGHRQTGNLESHQGGDDTSLQYFLPFGETAGDQQQAEHGRPGQDLQQGKQAEAAAVSLKEGHGRSEA